jgi:hypothetical protein
MCLYLPSEKPLPTSISQVQNESIDILQLTQESREAFQVVVESNVLADCEEAPYEQSRGLGQTDVFVPPHTMSTPPPEPSVPAVPVFPMSVYNVHDVPSTQEQ